MTTAVHSCCKTLCGLMSVTMLALCLSSSVSLAMDAEDAAVLTAFTAHCEKIGSLEFSETGDIIDAQSGERSHAFQGTYRIEFRLSSSGSLPRFFSDIVQEEVDRWGDPEGNVTSTKAVKRRVKAYDGSVWRHLFTEPAKTGGTADISRSAGTEYAVLAAQAIFVFDRYSISKLMEGAITSGTMEWNGRRVYVIDAFASDEERAEGRRSVRFYVDPEHDFAMCRYERRTYEGELSAEMDVKEFVRQDGIWLPAVVEQRIHVLGQTVPCKISYSRINTVFSGDDFTIEWPSGVLVTDQIAGVTYWTGAQSMSADERQALPDSAIAGVAVESSAPTDSALPARASQAANTASGTLPAEAASNHSGGTLARVAALAVGLAGALLAIVLIAAGRCRGR